MGKSLLQTGRRRIVVIRNMTADRLPIDVRLTNCSIGVIFQNPGSEVGYQCVHGANIDSLNFMALIGEIFYLTPCVDGPLGSRASTRTLTFGSTAIMCPAF